MTEIRTPGAAGVETSTPPPGRVRDRAQLWLCGGLALLGGLVLLDAARLGSATSSNDPVGPRPVEVVVGVALLLVAAFYTLDVLRGGRGEADEGEDVDLDHPADWRTVAVLAGVFLLNALLVDRLGWVVTGALLFHGTAFALGNRHHVRGLAIGAALSLATFYGFAIGLGVNLPAGILQGVL